ncbi:MAG: LytTR family DNA-binding domain-containing protein, partial [Bacteroidota bacterium]
SYNQYAIRAIRQNALDYLLKPIEDKELANAVLKAYDRLQKRPNQPSHKVAIPVTNGYRFLSVDEILYCEADDNRTIVHLYSNKTIRTSRTLKKVEELLAAYKFVRIHRAFLINRDYLEEYSRIDGGYVIMSNGKRLPVSRKNLNLS